MARVDYLGGLRKRFDHIKVLTDGHEDYEPSMVLYREAEPGRCFIIPQGAIWKYIEPKDNLNVQAWDRREFDMMASKVWYRSMLFMNPSLRRQNAEDAAAIVFAEQFNMATGILLGTAFSLFKCCQILGITVNNNSLAQLLMFIQNDLDKLKNMEPAEPENKKEIGEAVYRVDGKTFYAPVELTETDVARHDLENAG